MTHRGVAARGVLAVVVAVTAAVPLWVDRSGTVDDVANQPAVVLPMAVATLSLLWAAGRLDGPGQRAVRWWMRATGSAMFGYLAATAAVAWWAGHGGATGSVTQVLVATQGLAWAPPIALLGLTLLAAVASLGLSRSAIARATVALLVLNLVTLPILWLATAPAPDSPYADLPPLWDNQGLAVVADALLVPWLLAILVAPLMAWRAVPRAPKPVRGRVLAIAVVSVGPWITITFCGAAALLAMVAGVLSLRVGAFGLALAYFLPMAVTGPVVVHALSWSGSGQPSVERTSAVLTVVLGAPLLIVTVTLGWLLSAALGGGGVVLVLLGTLVLAALASAGRRWLVRVMIDRVDPVRGRAACLVAQLGDTTAALARDLEWVVRESLSQESRVSLSLPGGGWVALDGTAAPRPSRPTTESAHVDPPHDDAAAVLDEVRPLVDRALLELSVRAQEIAVAAAQTRAHAAAAEERRRLERDLHDGVQGRLLALALDLRVAQRRLPGGEADLVIADAVEALAKAIDELRALSQGTGSAVLSHQGLRTAVAEFSGRMPLPVTVVGAPERLPPATQSVIYMAVCEAVTNAVKHASATSVEVDIRAGVDDVVLTVVDDGVGGADLRAGTGLQGLAERVSAIGGQLVVSDRQPHGTLVEVALPCGS